MHGQLKSSVINESILSSEQHDMAMRLKIVGCK